MFTRPLRTDLPSTIDGAVDILLEDLRLLDRTRLGSMAEAELELMNQAVGRQITRDFRLWSGNEVLLHECVHTLEENGDSDADPTMAIIHALWQKLQDTHVLRLVK